MSTKDPVTIKVPRVPDYIRKEKKEVKLHIEDDREVSPEEVREIENRVNLETRQWAKMFTLGSRWGQEERVKKALLSWTSGCGQNFQTKKILK